MFTEALWVAPTRFASRGLALSRVLEMLREQSMRGDRILSTRADRVLEGITSSDFKEEYLLTEVGLTRNGPIEPTSIVKIATSLAQGKLSLEIELSLETCRVNVKSRNGREYNYHEGHAFDFIINFSNYMRPARFSPIIALKTLWSACLTIFLDEALNNMEGMLITGTVKGEKFREAIPKIVLKTTLNDLPNTRSIDDRSTGYVDGAHSKVFYGDNIWVDVQAKYPDPVLIQGLKPGKFRERCCKEFLIELMLFYPQDPSKYNLCLKSMRKLLGPLTDLEFYTAWTDASAHVRDRNPGSLWEESPTVP